MPTVKIEHADPTTSHAIAFDIMGAAPRDKDGKVLPDSDGNDREVDETGNEVRETFVIRPGHFKVMDFGGGLVLRQVSAGELAEREREQHEEDEARAAVIREQRQKDDAEHAKKVEDERQERKAKAKKKLDDEAAAAKSHDAEFGDNWKPGSGTAPIGHEGDENAHRQDPDALRNDTVNEGRDASQPHDSELVT